MRNMFGFSKRRTKLGRLRVHLGDPLQGTRSPARPSRRLGQSNGEDVVLPGSGRSEDLDCQCSSGGFELHKSGVGNPESWMVLSTEGEEPAPRFNHAATIVGSKMVVVGGDSGGGMLNDTVILRMDKLTWYTAAPKASLPSKGSSSSKIPACKGHCLVNWGNMVLLIGGKTDPLSDRVSVWSFNMDTEFWSHVEVKGDIPAARSGHTVTKAGPVLILFGGEDAKGKKLNDLHMFDLKSSTWLQLHYKGTGPSPRSNHVAALYDDKILLIFGGQSKKRILNDFYSLNFETMVWSRIKIRGHHPSPRAGCCGALCGNKWFVVGGGSKKKRHAETLVFDVVKFECSASFASCNSSIAINKGFSIVPVHYQDKNFLVAFGGNQKEPSNQVEILMMAENEHSMSWRSAPDRDPLLIESYTTTKELADHLHSGACSHSVDCVAKHNLVSTVEQYTSDRKSISDSFIDPNSVPGSISLQNQFRDEEDNLVPKMQKTLEVDRYKEGDVCTVIEYKNKQQETSIQMDIARVLASPEEIPLGADSMNSNLHQKQGNDDITLKRHHSVPMETNSKLLFTNPSNLYQLYETKIATLTRKNALLEGQLIAEMAGREAAEKNLSTAIKSRQDLDRTLADTMKEVELLKEKLAGVELAQEETNSLSNSVHADNVRLEHDVAFLKAVLDDTQKELHSTRGVLAGERARAFQLQVEVFHLKQRFQSLEGRASTLRKPFHM